MASFEHRALYINFAEHLQNTWNPNMYFLSAPNRWSIEDWDKYFKMISSFGFNIFEFWLVPTLFDKPALNNSPIHINFAKEMREIINVAHNNNLKVKCQTNLNCIGPHWYFACPNDKEERKLIFDLWDFWRRELPDVDIVGFGPGDPGGCNRKGCSYKTFVETSLEIYEKIVLKYNPNADMAISTWGSPFSGWDDDMVRVPNWDGTWEMITNPTNLSPEIPAHIWNGKRDRCRKAMDYLLSKLKDFPKNCEFSVNLGFSPNCTYVFGGSSREWAREIAKTHKVTTWDYALAEGELFTVPHYRLPRISYKAREWEAVGAYSGGIIYTMTPKLQMLTTYVSGKILNDTNTNPDIAACDFFEALYGNEHRELGELFEAFEVLIDWGHFPRHQWSKESLREAYLKIIEHLENADSSECVLPIFPDAETYRKDILWFAKLFLKFTEDNPDRDLIKKEYWDMCLDIYNYIPKAVDDRAEWASRDFAKAFSREKTWFEPSTYNDFE